MPEAFCPIRTTRLYSLRVFKLLGGYTREAEEQYISIQVFDTGVFGPGVSDPPSLNGVKMPNNLIKKVHILEEKKPQICHFYSQCGDESSRTMRNGRFESAK